MKVSNIPVGQGRTGTIAGRDVAVYRDEGSLIVLASDCPHLGCEVAWHPKDETWSCPCHLSRFTRKGDLLSGPAPAGLTLLDFKVEDDEIKLA